jgi:GGDEF domain-containing protein
VDFTARIEDEIYRSSRYQIPFSIVVASLAFTNRGTLEALDDFVRGKLRRLDVPGALSDRDFAIALPHTDRRGAEIVADRLRAEMLDFSPFVGVGSFPEDGTTSDALLRAALQDAHHRQGRSAA